MPNAVVKMQLTSMNKIMGSKLARKGRNNMKRRLFNSLITTAAIALFATSAIAEPIKVACIGDSITAGVDKTSLYLRSLFGLREFLWRQRLDRDLSSKEKQENRVALEAIRKRLQSLIVEWKRFPREAGDWRMTFRYYTPAIERRGVFPSWYSRGEGTTLEGIVRTPPSS